MIIEVSFLNSMEKSGWILAEDFLRQNKALRELELQSLRSLSLLDSNFRLFLKTHTFVNIAFKDELDRLRYLYKAYLASIDAGNASVIEKLFSKIKQKYIFSYILVLIFQTQKRQHQKVKSLYPPIKIIPASLRPIKFAA